MFSLRKEPKRSPKSKRPTGPWVTYERCFLLTLGGIFTGLALFGIKAFSAAKDKPPEWLPLVLACMAILGVFMIAVGFFGSRKDAKALAETSSSGQAAILVVMILATPLYWVLKSFEKKKR